MMPANLRELRALLCSLREGELSANQALRIEELLSADSEARLFYVRYMDLCANLFWSTIRDDGQRHLMTQLDARANEDHPGTNATSAFPPVLTLTSLHTTVGYFPEGMPLAYLLATVITGLGLLIGSHIYMSRPEQVVRKSVPSVVVEPKTEPVGRITGMVDCKWVGTAADSPAVPLGRKYELASGLMEITYGTGAKVILQGPVTYEVEANGGYLSVGKLTGKLETKTKDRRPKTEDAGRQNSPFPLPPSPFVVRTPTATVTDLGTEFGVEVLKDQQNRVQVFQGKIVVEARGPTAGTSRRVELCEGESARIESHGTVTRYSGPHAVNAAGAIGFVRKIPRQIVKTLNLVDVVAGGDGFGTACDRGIDPSTGKTATSQASKPRLFGDGRYHRVEGLPFVDGVFVPHDTTGSVQLDSAGHVFNDFPKTDNRSWGYIWAGGAIPIGETVYSLPTTLRCIDYALPDHAVLGMHANKGITFNLEAIRRANPQYKILRFLAVAGNPATYDESVRYDAWVFVDGRPRFRRERVECQQQLAIRVELDDRSRFLTLVVTDGGDSYASDQVIFGDPRLVLTTTSAEERGK